MKNNFNRFTDINHRPLRIYNRAVMFHNLCEDQGPVVAGDYAETFSPEERLEIAQMTALVRKIGVKRVQQLVTDGIDFVDEEFVEEVAA